MCSGWISTCLLGLYMDCEDEATDIVKRKLLFGAQGKFVIASAESVSHVVQCPWHNDECCHIIDNCIVDAA